MTSVLDQVIGIIAQSGATGGRVVEAHDGGVAIYWHEIRQPLRVHKNVQFHDIV